MRIFHKTSFKGVRYRQHPTRKHGVQPDKYYVLTYKLNGKTKTEAVGWASEGVKPSDAYELLAELKRNQKTGQGPQTLAEKRRLLQDNKEAELAEQKRLERENITFGQAFEAYFPHTKANKSKRSYQREESLNNLWISPVIGEMPLKDIRPIHLERIKKNMADKGRAARSIEYALAVIRQVFNFARYNGMFAGDSPTSKVKKPKVDNRRLRFLTKDEAETLLDALKKRSRQLYEMALVSLHCGLRAGEIFNLTWGDVLLDREMLVLRNTKNGRTRIAYMTSRVRRMLAEKQPGGNDDLVFTSAAGGRIKSISNAFDRAIRELGFNKGVTDSRQRVVFHSLRHTYASWLVQGGVDLYTVKELLGHSTLAMTERYSHLAPDALQKAVRTLEADADRSRVALFQRGAERE